MPKSPAPTDSARRGMRVEGVLGIELCTSAQMPSSPWIRLSQREGFGRLQGALAMGQIPFKPHSGLLGR